MVEQAAVNRRVGGSKPSSGATKSLENIEGLFLFVASFASAPPDPVDARQQPLIPAAMHSSCWLSARA